MIITEEEFLKDARRYVTDTEIDAAYAMLQDPGLTPSKACAHYGAGLLVVMALQGKLKEVVISRGKVAPGLRFVDPWQEPACIDHGNIAQKAAFAIWRTLERPPGEPVLCERGALVQ